MLHLLAATAVAFALVDAPSTSPAVDLDAGVRVKILRPRPPVPVVPVVPVRPARPRPPVPVVPVVPVRPARPHPERPDDGLLGKGKFEVTVKLPAEVLSLIQHADEDRGGIAGYVTWALWLLTAAVGCAALATLRYVVSGWRRAPESRPPWETMR